jgi:DNA polymerase-3 subunit beta
MKLSILGENLKRGLGIVNRAVAGKSILPVLNNVLLKTDDGRLKLVGTNLEQIIITRVGAKIEDEGSITLPAKLLSEIVNGLPNVPIELTLDDKTQVMAWSCGGYKGTIHGLSADEFPTLPMITGSAVTLPADVLRNVGTRVAIAAAGDEARPVLSGIRMRLDDMARFVASDGFRLADLRVPLETPAEPQEAIIPARALSTLASILDGDSVVVAFSDNGGQVSFKTESTELISRLIDGKYPDVDRMIPTKYTTRAVVKTADLAAAVKLAGLYRIDKTSEMQSKNYLAFAGDSCQVSASMAEMGDQNGKIEALIEGSVITMCLNNNYLSAAIASCGSGEIAIEMQTQRNPAVFRSVGDESFFHLLMPMAIR